MTLVSELRWNLDEYFSKSKEAEFNPKVVYDIGAFEGTFSAKAQEHFPDATYHLFEPNTQHNEKMAEYGSVHNVTLYSRPYRAQFWSNDTGGDSLYKEIATDAYKEVDSKLVTTVTLDGYVEQNGLEYPDLIKIDTQGSELDILEGGQKCMAHAKMLILECPILPYNEGAPSFNEYINYLGSRGFLPIYVTEVHMLNGIVCQIDMAFVNTRGQQ